MTSIYADGLVAQIRRNLEFGMNDFLDYTVDEVTDSIRQAKDEQWVEIRKQLKYTYNTPD